MATSRLARIQRCSCITALVLLASIDAGAQDSAANTDSEKLRQQVEQLDQLAVRTQSHVMMDVEYQFTNLWFAAQSEQWDLAAFYLRETRSHLDWMVRIRPVRRVAGGGSVDLKPFQESITQGGFAQMAKALDGKDHDTFEAAYKQTLGQCLACHAASGLPYLAPHVPDRPSSMLMIKDKDK